MICCRTAKRSPLVAWLEQHQGTQLDVVSRDRGGAYAEGARRGAPQAIQVADRFHLLQNLGQALDRLLIREHRVLAQVADAVAQANAEAVQEREQETEVGRTTGEPERRSDAVPPVGDDDASAQSAAPLTPLTRMEREHAAVEARRRARYDRVVALAHEGYSLREIARRANVSRGTVRSYLRAGAYRPCATRGRQPQACAPFTAYLRQRWNEGEHNSATLLAEIRQQGYRGAASTVRQYVSTWRTGPRRPGRRRTGEDDGPTPPVRRRRFSARQTRWVLLRSREDLDEDERTYRQALCQESPTIACAQTLVEDFGRIVRTRAQEELDGWLEQVTQSHIPELMSFANGIRRDAAAVAAALSLPHSQGQVEGQVNRLKMLKRQTYGRANLDLLRQRVLYHAA